MNYKKDHVDIITLNYNGEKILPLLLDSLKKIDYKEHSIHVVDNGSSDGSVSLMKKKYSEVNLIEAKKNLFFSKGNNLAIDQTNGEFILLINNDIIVTPDFLTHMVELIKTDKQIAAVASKMMLNDNPTMLDSVGTAILDNGAAFNVGIGQVDIGQYDEVRQVFGACFGCVLIRRELYEGAIGKLDNDFFGYYEDTDWSFRANILGYKVMLQPKAKVFHAHSVSTRKNIPEWKHFLIQRNYIWTAQKNYRFIQAFKITYVRYRELLKDAWKSKSVRRLFINLRIIFYTILFGPKTLVKRFKTQSRRVIADKEIVKFSDGEAPFFEDINYQPIYTLDNLEHSLKRVMKLNNKYKPIYDSIRSLNSEKEPNHKEWDKKAQKVLEGLEFLNKTEKENFINAVVKNKIWVN
jgi:GT2 family glycosyltransferase